MRYLKTEGLTDRQTDGRTDGRTDGQTDGQGRLLWTPTGKPGVQNLLLLIQLDFTYILKYALFVNVHKVGQLEQSMTKIWERRARAITYTKIKKPRFFGLDPLGCSK